MFGLMYEWRVTGVDTRQGGRGAGPRCPTRFHSGCLVLLVQTSET